MADQLTRLWEEIRRAVPGEDHSSSITYRGRRAVCHSRGECCGPETPEATEATEATETPGAQETARPTHGSNHDADRAGGADGQDEAGGPRAHYITYLEKLGPAGILGELDEPITRAPDHVIRDLMRRRSRVPEIRGIHEEAEHDAQDLPQVDEEPPLEVRYLRAFEPDEAFEAGQLFQELSMAIRGQAISLPETMEDEDFIAQQELDIQRGMKLVKETVSSSRRVTLMQSLLEAEEKLVQLKESEESEESGRSFWEITHEQLVRDLEELIPDPEEREDMLKIQRLRRG